MTAREIVLVIATVIVGIGLMLILWRELAGAEERRRVGTVRDIIEVLAPFAATAVLVVAVWLY